MSKQISTAIASFGMSGQVFHGPCLKVNPRFHIASILERSKSLSQEHYPHSSIVRSYDDILSNKEIDLVVVNTPDKYHYEMCKAALLAGKHVVVEKPFTQHLWQAEELIRLAQERHRILSVFQNRRLDGDFLTLKKIVEEKRLGRLVEFESHFDRYRNFIQKGTWKEKEDPCNGVLYNLGSHMIDQALMLFGAPLSVTANLQTLRSDGKVNDYYDIRLQYNKFCALLKCSYLVREAGPRYQIHGTLGSFQKWGIDPQEHALKQGHLPNTADWGSEAESEWGILHTEENGAPIRKKLETVKGNYATFYDKLYDTIVFKKPLLVKPEEAFLTLKIIKMCEKSNETNQTVFLS